MHQNYEDVDYDPGKKYVELACYTDTTTNKVIAYEVRLFSGNFREMYEEGLWYAKSVTFNSSFTWDIDNYVEVDFGMPLGEEDSVFIPEFKITAEQQSFIDAVGDVGKIYHNLHGISDTTWGEKQVQIESHLVEYKNLKENVKSKFFEENGHPFDLLLLYHPSLASSENRYDYESASELGLYGSSNPIAYLE